MLEKDISVWRDGIRSNKVYTISTIDTYVTF